MADIVQLIDTNTVMVIFVTSIITTLTYKVSASLAKQLTGKFLDKTKNESGVVRVTAVTVVLVVLGVLLFMASDSMADRFSTNSTDVKVAGIVIVVVSVLFTLMNLRKSIGGMYQGKTKPVDVRVYHSPLIKNKYRARLLKITDEPR